MQVVCFVRDRKHESGASGNSSNVWDQERDDPTRFLSGIIFVRLNGSVDIPSQALAKIEKQIPRSAGTAGAGNRFRASTKGGGVLHFGNLPACVHLPVFFVSKFIE